MFSKIKKFKATAWKKAGKYDAGHNRHVLLAMLIGVGMIAWFLLKFIWIALDAAIKKDKEDKSSSFDLPEDVTLDNYALTNYGKKTGESVDIYGRTPGDAFYGSVSFLDPITLEKMNEK
jgi:hypothetical protein